MPNPNLRLGGVKIFSASLDVKVLMHCSHTAHERDFWSTDFFPRLTESLTLLTRKWPALHT